MNVLVVSEFSLISSVCKTVLERFCQIEDILSINPNSVHSNLAYAHRFFKWDQCDLIIFDLDSSTTPLTQHYQRKLELENKDIIRNQINQPEVVLISTPESFNGLLKYHAKPTNSYLLKPFSMQNFFDFVSCSLRNS